MGNQTRETEDPSSVKIANTIQCSLKGCHLRFPSVEAMKKHKTKMKKNQNDDIHDFYCERCDCDCEDDVEYLIHQIQSPKHIVCPACGMEFKSEGGRNRHVGIAHRQKQNLNCAGCKEKFTSCAALIGHIEGDKCKLIKKDDFHRHRAEQQIERDAFEQMEGGMLHGSIFPGSQLGVDEPSGMSLLEDQRVHIERDWQGVPISMAPSAGTELFDRQKSNITQSMSDLAIDKYPPLQAERQYPSTSSRTGHLSATTTSTTPPQGPYDPTEQPYMKPGQFTYGDPNVWEASKAARRQKKVSRNLLDDDSSVGLQDSTISGSAGGTAATWGTRPPDLSERSDLIPQAARPDYQDPNAHIQIRPQLRMPSRDKLQSYWDPIQGAYVCPGSKCGRKLRSVKEFEEHLLSGAHSGGTVQCPSCLKRFKTTTALVAHAESGSIKCDLRHTEEFDLVIQSITAGLIRVEGTWSGTENPKFGAVPIDEW